MRADHLDAGEELRVRHQAAAGRQAARARRHLRVRPADRRHRRRHDAGRRRRSPPWRKPAARCSTSASAAIQIWPARTTRCCSRWPTPGVTSPSPCRRSASSSTGAWRTCAAPLPDVRRSAVLLPLRGRLDRPAVPGHLRHQRCYQGGSRGGLPAGRLPGRGPAADEHPARHPRGSRQRAGLPARRRPGQVRLRPGRTPTLPSFTRLVEFEAERARDWYATGLQLLPMLDRRSAACTGAMAGIYRRLLDRIAAQPAAVLRGRMSLSAGEKAVVAVKALAGRIA